MRRQQARECKTAADANRTRCFQIYIKIGHKPTRNHTSHPKVKKQTNKTLQKTTQPSHLLHFSKVAPVIQGIITECYMSSLATPKQAKSINLC